MCSSGAMYMGVPQLDCSCCWSSIGLRKFDSPKSVSTSCRSSPAVSVSAVAVRAGVDQRDALALRAVVQVLQALLAVRLPVRVRPVAFALPGEGLALLRLCAGAGLPRHLHRGRCTVLRGRALHSVLGQRQTNLVIRSHLLARGVLKRSDGPPPRASSTRTAAAARMMIPFSQLEKKWQSGKMLEWLVEKVDELLDYSLRIAVALEAIAVSLAPAADRGPSASA